MHVFRSAAVLEMGAEAFGAGGATTGAAGADAAALAYDCFDLDSASRAGGGLGTRGGGRVGDRGGLGGGDWGLVSETTGCTAAGSVGAGRDVGGPAGVPDGVLRKKRKSLLATSCKRVRDSLSRARRSSWSFCKRVTRRDLRPLPPPSPANFCALPLPSSYPCDSPSPRAHFFFFFSER